MKGTSMQEQLVELVEEMRKKGVSIKDTPPIFEWRYDNLKGVTFKLLISEEVVH